MKSKSTGILCRGVTDREVASIYCGNLSSWGKGANVARHNRKEDLSDVNSCMLQAYVGIAPTQPPARE